jgi:hypothetical protein
MADYAIANPPYALFNISRTVQMSGYSKLENGIRQAVKEHSQGYWTGLNQDCCGPLSSVKLDKNPDRRPPHDRKHTWQSSSNGRLTESGIGSARNRVEPMTTGEQHGLSRRLAAILAADVAGYSQLMVVIWSLSLAAAITLIYFRFPGEMNNDSVSQFNQAVTNQYSDWHPPVMALLWHFLRVFYGGTGSLFVVHILFYWLGLTCCALYLLRLNRPFSALSCLGIGLIPVFLMIVINLHKDVGVAVAMVSAFGLICLSPAGLSFRLAGFSFTLR